MDSAGYFFVGVFIFQIILYSWAHLKKSSGTALRRFKYEERAALITKAVFIVVLCLAFVAIIGDIIGIFG